MVKLILDLVKYIIPFVLFICFAVWSLLFIAKTQYVGEYTKLKSVTGKCSNAYYETHDNISIGKYFDMTDLIIIVEIDGEKFVITDQMRKRQLEKYLPENVNFVDSCIGKTLDIKYTVKGDSNHIQSLTIPSDETVFIDLEKVRTENITTLVFLSVFYVLAIIFFGILCIGSCIQTLKTPPTIKQLRKWHNSRKRQTELKEKQRSEQENKQKE